MAYSRLSQSLLAGCLPNRPKLTTPPKTAPPHHDSCAHPIDVASSAAGFSLLEMIVIVVIVSILAAIAAPGWLTLVNRQRLNSARDEVLQAMRSAQVQAKQSRRPELLEFDSSGTLPKVQGIELGSGNLKPNMVSMTVTDNGGNAIKDIDEDGLPDIQFDQHGAISEESTPDNWPIKIVLSTSSTYGPKRCILVDSLLGSTRLMSDSECN